MFTPTAVMMQPGIAIVPIIPMRTDLDSGGSFAVVLAANDDFGTLPPAPVQAQYEVCEYIVGGLTQCYLITVSHTVSGGTVDLSALLAGGTPVPPPGGYSLLGGLVG
jgi:hypothetical protein